MKIICLKDNLKLGVNLAEKLVGKNLNLPILSNFLLSTEKGMLKITATDLELGINIWINTKVEKEGVVSIPAKLFSNIINNFSEDKLTLEAKNNNLKISSKNFNFQITGFDPKEFPILPKIDKEINLEINANLLQETLSQVVSAASFSEVRPELGGVFFKLNKEQIKIVATDSFRLAEKTINKKFKITNQNIPSFIIPLRAVQEIIRILDEKDKVNIKISKNQFLFEVENINLVGRLIEGDYPDYEQIIPKNHLTKTIVKRNELINAVKLASFFSSKINDVKLAADSEKKQIEVASADSERGQSTIQVKAETQGQASNLSFNHHYLLDGLNNISDENLVIEFNGETTPTIFRPVSNDTYLYLTLPIKNI